MMNSEYARSVLPAPSGSMTPFRIRKEPFGGDSIPAAPWPRKLAWIWGAYWLAIFLLLRPLGDGLHQSWSSDRLVLSYLLSVLFVAPALVAWKLSSTKEGNFLPGLIWYGAFFSTFFVPWWGLGLIHELKIPLLSERSWYLYFGELTWLRQVPVLYGGALVVYILIRHIQGGMPSYRSKLIPMQKNSKRSRGNS